MNQTKTTIKRALISVSNKNGIVAFAQTLIQSGIEILSTGGTSETLRAANIPVTDVADITNFPEIMHGRVKTLHPKIHGGILGLRDAHEKIAREHSIGWIDLVIVNLYPFADTIKNSQTTLDDAIENIDIGGPAMIRSAAKNMGWVGVIVDPNDYADISHELISEQGLSFATRKKLATKAFAHTAEYDALITAYLSAKNEDNVFHQSLHLHLEKSLSLRYGENPQQSSAAYRLENTTGILTAKQFQGKELSFNNITDADAAVIAVKEFQQPTCVIVKHANPCGVATANNIDDAYNHAFHADAVSAFGGIVALNQVCTSAIAKKAAEIFLEVFIAPGYTDEALAIFAKKPNLRVLECDLQNVPMKYEWKFIEGGLLMQTRNCNPLQKSDLKIVTKKIPTDSELDELLFAWQVVKHVKSNAIVITKNNVTVGIGAGQVSRIDAVDIAIRKASDKANHAVLASDAFFPFRDSIDHMAHSGIHAIIQPGGSVRDDEVIAACDEYGIAMVFTGVRCFKH